MMGKMRAYYDGSEATSLSIELGEDGVFNLLLCDGSNGVPKDLDGGTVDVLCYTSTARTSGSLVKTISGALGADTGTATFAIANDEATLTQTTYYLWAKLTQGGAVTISDRASTLIVR
jgi:phage tail protein X